MEHREKKRKENKKMKKKKENKFEHCSHYHTRFFVKKNKQKWLNKMSRQFEQKLVMGKLLALSFFPPVRFSLCTGASVKSRKYLAMRVDGLNFFLRAYELYKKKKKGKEKKIERVTSRLSYTLSLFFFYSSRTIFLIHFSRTRSLRYRFACNDYERK